MATSRGVGLIEVLLASALVAVAALILAGLLGQAQQQIVAARREALALALAESVAEVIQARGYHGLQRLAEDHGCAIQTATRCPLPVAQDPLLARWGERAREGFDGALTLQLEAADRQPLDTSRLLRVQVEVRWSQADRVRRLRLLVMRS